MSSNTLYLHYVIMSLLMFRINILIKDNKYTDEAGHKEMSIYTCGELMDSSKETSWGNTDKVKLQDRRLNVYER